MITALMAALIAFTPNAPAHTEIHPVTPASATNVAPSVYRGKWYSGAAETARRCIIWRESHGNYRARNASGHAGAYQFNDRAWRVSLTYMLIREHRTKRAEIIALRVVPINRWPRYWQDAAFFTAWRDGHGAKHWHLNGSRCNALVVVA